MPLTRDQAIERLADYLQASEFPELNSAELGVLIDRYKRFTTWAVSTVYAVGDVVVPPTPNGRKYECVVAGTSGTDTTLFPDYAGNNYNQIFGDGTVVKWVDKGPVSREQYDVMSSTRAGWLMKATKVSNLIGTQDGQQKIDSQLLQKQFIEMANRFRPMEII